MGVDVTRSGAAGGFAGDLIGLWGALIGLNFISMSISSSTVDKFGSSESSKSCVSSCGTPPFDSCSNNSPGFRVSVITVLLPTVIGGLGGLGAALAFFFFGTGSPSESGAFLFILDRLGAGTGL